MTTLGEFDDRFLVETVETCTGWWWMMIRLRLWAYNLDDMFVSMCQLFRVNPFFVAVTKTHIQISIHLKEVFKFFDDCNMCRGRTTKKRVHNQLEFGWVWVVVSITKWILNAGNRHHSRAEKTKLQWLLVYIRQQSICSMHRTLLNNNVSNRFRVLAAVHLCHQLNYLLRKRLLASQNF